jgi:hypothetical protein
VKVARRITAALALLLLLSSFALSALASTHFARSCPVTGASPQKLSAVLSACGFSGVATMQELTIKNPDAAAGTLYVGQSDVSAANGFALAAGDSLTERAASQQDPIPAESIYLFVASTQSAHFVARSK